MQLNTEILTVLSDFAKSLPNNRRIPRVLLGEQLLSRGVKEVDNVRVKPNKRYVMVPKDDYEHHFKELKAIYKKLGTPGVVSYMSHHGSAKNQ